MTQIFNRFIITYKAAYTGLPREAWLLSVVVLVNRAGSMVLFFMTLYLTSKKDYSVAEAGQMISVYGFGSLFGAYLGGWLSDRIGAKHVQLISLLLSGFVFILLAYMTTRISIAVTLFFLALISESFRPANATAFARICPPEMRARGFALLRLAVNFGVAIGPALGGILATINYKLLFWIDGITCLSAALLLAITIPAEKINIIHHATSVSERGKSPFRDSIFVLLLLLLLYLGMVFVQIFNTWPLHLKSVYHFPEIKIGLLLALNAILIVLIEMPLIHKVERKNPLRVMALGAFLLFAGFSLTILNSSYLFIAFTVIVWTFGEMLIFPIVSGYIANRADDHNRGKYMGMYTFTFALSFVIGPAVGAYIYDNLGPVALWGGIGFAGLLVILVFRVIYDVLRRRGGI